MSRLDGEIPLTSLNQLSEPDWEFRGHSNPSPACVFPTVAKWVSVVQDEQWMLLF